VGARWALEICWRSRLILPEWCLGCMAASDDWKSLRKSSFFMQAVRTSLELANLKITEL
jgi:hypothetical protein